MKIYVLIEHSLKYYDNIGGVNNMFNICNELKNRGFDVKIIIQNFIKKNPINNQTLKFADCMKNVFNDITMIDCINIKKEELLNYYIKKSNIQKEDIIIATLWDYIDFLQDYNQNILIYIHGGSDGYIKNHHPITFIDKIKYNFPIIYYDSFWKNQITNHNYKKLLNIKEDKYTIFTYFTVNKFLIEKKILKKTLDSCFHIQKNKYNFKLIHNIMNSIHLNMHSLDKSLLILAKTKFFYAYDIHSLYVNFALILHNNIIIPKYKNMSKSEFMEFYKQDSKRNNEFFYDILNKYLIYIETEEDMKNIKYIEFEEEYEYLFDNLINKFHNLNFKSYIDLNNDTINRLSDLIYNLNLNDYLRVQDLKNCAI